MNSRRKILAVLLLVVMAVSLLSVCALAADDGDDVAKSITCTTCNGTGVSQGEECGACEGTGEITSTSRISFSVQRALVAGLFSHSSMVRLYSTSFVANALPIWLEYHT